MAAHLFSRFGQPLDRPLRNLVPPRQLPLGALVAVVQHLGQNLIQVQSWRPQAPFLLPPDTSHAAAAAAGGAAAVAVAVAVAAVAAAAAAAMKLHL